MVTSRVWFTAAQKAELWERHANCSSELRLRRLWDIGFVVRIISMKDGSRETRQFAISSIPVEDRARNHAAVQRR
jgi:hypothetical protein